MELVDSISCNQKEEIITDIELIYNMQSAVDQNMLAL